MIHCGIFLIAKKTKSISKTRKYLVVSLTGYGKKEPRIANKKEKIISFNQKTSSMNYFERFIQIGKGTTKIVIPKEYIKYVHALSRGIVNTITGQLDLEIQETIEIYTSKKHNKDSKWGTLELKIKVKEDLSKEPIFPVTVGKVKGHGTGALKGAIVEGVDKLWKKVECADATNWGWGYAVNYVREGTITEWPPEVTSWPPKN